MPGATEARRAMMVLARHNKPLEDAFLSRALLNLREPRWTLEWAIREISRSRKLDNLRGGIGFNYPHPAPTYEGEEAKLSLVLRQSSGFQVSNTRTIMTPLLESEADKWIRLTSYEKKLSHTSQIDVDWFIEKAQQFLPSFEPDFACGHTDVLLANRLEDDPRKSVWPLAYYGPELVQKLGRKALLEAPVWESKEDERGGIWLQVTENPFTATSADVNPLAAYLGLEKWRR